MDEFLCMDTCREVVGQETAISELRKWFYQIKTGKTNPAVLKGVPRSIMVYGTEGCGKTCTAHLLSQEWEQQNLIIEIVSDEERLEHIVQRTKSVLAFANLATGKKMSAGQMAKKPDVVIVDDLNAFTTTAVSKQEIIKRYLNKLAIKKKKEPKAPKKEPKKTKGKPSEKEVAVVEKKKVYRSKFDIPEEEDLPVKKQPADSDPLPFLLLICNEPYSRSLSDIKKKCNLLVKFNTLTDGEVKVVLNCKLAKYLKRNPQETGLSHESVEEIAEQSRGDARKASIEAYLKMKTKKVKASRDSSKTESSDVRVGSLFEATSYCFSNKITPKKLTFDDPKRTRDDVLTSLENFNDLETALKSDELMSYMIHENGYGYFQSCYNYSKNHRTELNIMTCVSNFTDHFSYADLMQRSIVEEGNWCLASEMLWSGSMSALQEIRNAKTISGLSYSNARLQISQLLGHMSKCKATQKKQVDFFFQHGNTLQMKHKSFLQEKLNVEDVGISVSGGHHIEEQISYWTNVHQMLVNHLLAGRVGEASTFALYCNITSSEEILEIERNFFLSANHLGTLKPYSSVPSDIKTKFTLALKEPFAAKKEVKTKPQPKSKQKEEKSKTETEKEGLSKKRTFSEAFQDKKEKKDKEVEITSNKSSITNKAKKPSEKLSVAKRQKLAEAKPQQSALTMFFSKK